MFRISNNNVPVNIRKYFSLENTEYGLRQSEKFQVKFVRTTRKSQCLSVYGVKLFNMLDQSSKQTKTLNKFNVLLKRLLKYCLLMNNMEYENGILNPWNINISHSLVNVLIFTFIFPLSPRPSHSKSRNNGSYNLL